MTELSIFYEPKDFYIIDEEKNVEIYARYNEELKGYEFIINKVKNFYSKVEGDDYWWDISKRPTLGRHLCTHYEIWFHGVAFGGSKKIDTGVLTKGKIRKGLKMIYEHYRKGGVIK